MTTREELGFDRDYDCDGNHRVQYMRTVESLEVLICTDPRCAKVIAHCTHLDEEGKSRCVWIDDGKTLLCTFCGVDGT